MVQRRTTAPGGPAGTVQYIYGLDGELLAEADAATGRTLRDYIWLPQGDASPAADNDNEEGASSLPLPLALVTGVNTTPQLLTVHADHLNRPTRLTDATRATVWSASYDPFGQPVSITGTVEQNLRFPGQYFLIESGLSYNWHRFYDPTTGRYTQPDPLRFVDGPSLYGYAGQSPLMWVDPEGLDVVIIVNRNGLLGTHVGIYVTTPGDSAANTLYDPGGSYRNRERGSGDAFYGDDANFKDYFDFQGEGVGEGLDLYRFRTQPSDDDAFRSRIDDQWGCSGGFCAICAGTVLRGIGPFKDLGSTLTPVGMGRELQQLIRPSLKRHSWPLQEP